MSADTTDLILTLAALAVAFVFALWVLLVSHRGGK